MDMDIDMDVDFNQFEWLRYDEETNSIVFLPKCKNCGYLFPKEILKFDRNGITSILHHHLHYNLCAKYQHKKDVST